MFCFNEIVLKLILVDPFWTSGFPQKYEYLTFISNTMEKELSREFTVQRSTVGN